MKKFILILVILSTQAVFGQSQHERILDSYIENDKRYELECYYFNPSDEKLISPLDTTSRTLGKLSRSFQAISKNQTFNFDFKVTTSINKEANYEVKFNNGLLVSGVIKSNSKKSFYLATKRIDKKYKSFANKHELYKLFCQVNFAVEEITAIRDINTNLHINVHPHDKYDPKYLTIAGATAYFNDANYRSLVLLEEGNKKGNLVDLSNFLQMKKYSLVKNYYPESIKIPFSVELKVSPAGHNRYDFKTDKEVTITFTGGNHNYCMWNNTRNILTGLLRSESKSSLVIIYEMKSIVVQKYGLVGLNFSSRVLSKNNLLADVFKADRGEAIEYTSKYYNYFSNAFINRFKGAFKEFKLIQLSPYGNKTRVIKGTGKRKLQVLLNYR